MHVCRKKSKKTCLKEILLQRQIHTLHLNFMCCVFQYLKYVLEYMKELTQIIFRVLLDISITQTVNWLRKLILHHLKCGI